VAGDLGGSTSSVLGGRIEALDGLRGVAVLSVMWLHAMATIVPSHHWHLFGAGLGVDVFFVLSGFLITALLLGGAYDGPRRLRRFYGRRAARLLPALYVFLVVHLAVALVLGWSLRRELVTLVGALTFTSNWVPLTGESVAIASLPLWSLAVEEQFYLVWPAALGLLARWRTRTAVGVAIGAVVLVVVWRSVLTLLEGQGYPVVYQRTDARLDGLLIGAVLALVLHGGWRPTVRQASWSGVVGGAVLALWVANPAPFDDALFFGGFTVVALAAAGVVVGLLHGGATPARKLLEWRPLVAIGRVSYSLYLWHFLVFVLVRDSVPGGATVQLPVGVALSLAVAAASFHGIERPILQWSTRRLDPDRRPEVRPAPSRPRAGGALRPPWPVRAGTVAGLTAAVLLGSGVGLASAAKGGREAAPSIGAEPPTTGGGDVAEVAAPPTTAEVPEVPSTAPVVPSEPAPVERAPVEVPPGRDAPSLSPDVAGPLEGELVVSPPVVVPDLAPSGALLLRAQLSAGDGAPVVGSSVRLLIVAGSVASCVALTDDDGVAECTVQPSAPGPHLEVRAEVLDGPVRAVAAWSSEVPPGGR